LETHGSENANPKMGCLSENSKSWWKKEEHRRVVVMLVWKNLV
jgi:hypothetical protein